MKRDYYDAIRSVKNAIRTSGDKEGLQTALDILRTKMAEDNDNTLDRVGNLYKFNPSGAISEFELGYNSAIRDVLEILDPMKTRYKKREDSDD